MKQAFSTIACQLLLVYLHAMGDWFESWFRFNSSKLLMYTLRQQAMAKVLGHCHPYERKGQSSRLLALA